MSNALLLDLNDYMISPSSKSNSQSFSPSPFDHFAYAGPTSFDLLAPHPDLFDSELEASADLSALSALDITPFTSLDQTLHGHPGFYGDFRSGPASTITVSSESQSGYEFDTASYYSSHDSSSGYLPADGVSSPYAKHRNHSTYGTAKSDVELDFSDFNLTMPSSLSRSAVVPTSAVSTKALELGSSAVMEPPVALQQPYVKRPPADSVYPPPTLPVLVTAPDVLPKKREASGSPEAPAPPHHRGRINPDTSGPTKKYPCSHCPRSFARAFNLKTHMATHDPNRVKAFVCRHQGCGRSFSRKHDLGRHLTSIHGSRDGIHEDSESSLLGHRSSTESTSTTISRRSSNGNNNGRMYRERVWCDGCGRGWVKGTREACECDDEYRGD